VPFVDAETIVYATALPSGSEPTSVIAAGHLHLRLRRYLDHRGKFRFAQREMIVRNAIRTQHIASSRLLTTSIMIEPNSLREIK